jgi:cell division protein FtsI/penicillin-binding protein 2
VRSRLNIVFIVGALWVAALGVRLYDLQVVRHARYVSKAERQQQRVVKLDSPRGTIYDAVGRELAVSVVVDSAYAVPSEVQDVAVTARALAAVVPELSAARLSRVLAEDREFVWVARKLDPPVAEAVRRLQLPGIYFLPESKRYYPMRELAAQVLGYVGTDNHGLAGLELLYEHEIKGKPGIRTVLRDAKRGTLASPTLAVAEPEPGHDLHLTLDAAVQHMVEQELARVVAQHGAKRGSAVFLDPSTGAVLAMASYPGFDPNAFMSYPPASWRNRTIMDAYEPGSTFKIVTAAAALESGLVHPDDPFDCGMGSITLFGITIRDHKKYGVLPFADVIAKSSNVGVIRASLIIGGDRLYKTIRAFGFGKPTGIDLPGENGGILHPLARWGPLSKAYISFGQGISVTPLQLASAVTAVANEGRLLRPYVVAAVRRPKGLQQLHPTPTVMDTPASPATLREVKAMLERVVTSGTGASAAIPGYRVAGKTGTAQIPAVGGYSRHAYLPSFVGFAPVDHPAIVGVVAIDEPQGMAYYGAQVAAPVFGTLVRQILLYLGVRPQRPLFAVWPGEPGGATSRIVPAANRSDDDSAGEDVPEVWRDGAQGASSPVGPVTPSPAVNVQRSARPSVAARPSGVGDNAPL